MEIWNDFIIKHYGISILNDNYNLPSTKDYHRMKTAIKDKKTNYEIVTIYTDLDGKVLTFYVGTNEHMAKKLKLPMYKHFADLTYTNGKKHFDQKSKKGKMIPCVSLGAGNVQMIFKNIINEWKNQGYYIKSVAVDRETGNTKDKHVTRIIPLNKEYLK